MDLIGDAFVNELTRMYCREQRFGQRCSSDRKSGRVTGVTETGRATEVNGATETELRRQERDLSISLFESILDEDAVEACFSIEFSLRMRGSADHAERSAILICCGSARSVGFPFWSSVH